MRNPAQRPTAAELLKLPIFGSAFKNIATKPRPENFQVSSANTFSDTCAGEILFYFEPNTHNFHYIPIKELRNEKPKWMQFPVQGTAEITSLHGAVTTEEGRIFLIGGSSSSDGEQRTCLELDAANQKFIARESMKK